MISLSTLKKQRLTSNSKEKLQPLMIGFEGESQIEITKNDVKKKLKLWEEGLRLTGFYTNYWMWNLVFLNLFIAFTQGILISASFVGLPPEIGINLNNDGLLDYIIPRDWIYVPVFFHILILGGIIFIGIRSQKKLHHLYMVLFFQQIVLGIFEFIAIRNLLSYFIG